MNDFMRAGEVRVTNTFRNVEDREYIAMSPGTHVMGMIAIQNIKMKAFNPEDPEVDGFRLLFRSYENPNATPIMHRFSASSGTKSNAYKTLKLMSGGKLSEKSSGSELFDFMQTCLGKWFTVMLENKPWKDKFWTSVCQNMITPINPKLMALPEDAIKYFKDYDDGLIKKPEGDDLPWIDK